MLRLWNFFTVSGRASRRQYWLTILINVVVLASTIAGIIMFEMREYGRIEVPQRFDIRLLYIGLALAPLCIAVMCWPPLTHPGLTLSFRHPRHR